MKEIRTYNSLFDQWDELSAYVLGFWFADGSISCEFRKFSLYKRWRIHNNNQQILKVIAERIGAQITKGSRSKKSKNICYQIQLRSDKLFDFCYKLVGTTNKSKYGCIFPNIPHNLLNHFVRGFFDGDGSIYNKHYKNRHGKDTVEMNSSFTSSIINGSFLLELQRKIGNVIPINISKKLTGKKHRKWILCQKDTCELCKWIYNNANIFMIRKKLIWDNYKVNAVGVAPTLSSTSS